MEGNSRNAAQECVRLCMYPFTKRKKMNAGGECRDTPAPDSSWRRAVKTEFDSQPA